MRLNTDRRISLVLLVVISVLSAVPGAFAQDPIQPSLLLVFGGEAAEGVGDDPTEPADTLVSGVEGAFRSLHRYRITRETTTLTAQDYFDEHQGTADVAVFVTMVRRSDGSANVSTRVWDGREIVHAREDVLHGDERRFAIAERIAGELIAAAAQPFPGFGRVRFSNDGAAVPFFVYADDRLLGADLREIDLPVGRYHMEVRRRDQGFEQVVGRVRLSLEPDDFREVRFSMQRQAPPIPGYLRLMDPRERWKALFDLRGSYLIPLDGFEFADISVSAAGFATALFNDVMFRGVVAGFEAGQVYGEGTDISMGSDFSFYVTPAMAVLGLSVGPVSGVDFVARVGAGAALLREEVNDGTGGTAGTGEPHVRDDALAFSGVMEFGFGGWGNARVSLHTSWFGLYLDDSLYSLIGVGIGLGGRW